MMKVYICPQCGWVRTVSRRNVVECFKCGNPQMSLTRVTFEKYSSMDEQARRDYADSWLYIHRNDK